MIVKYVPETETTMHNHPDCESLFVFLAGTTDLTIDGKMVRKHACIDGPEIDAHIIDWDKFLPRFNQFKTQELESKKKHGFA